jgi:hypothetical protein
MRVSRMFDINFDITHPESIWNSNPLLCIIAILALILIYFLYIFIFDEDKCDSYRAIFWKGIYWISKRTDAEKKYIETDVNSAINIARKNMPFGKEHIPKSIKIRWFNENTEDLYQISENTLFVRLDPSESQKKNIAILAMVLVQNTALVGLRYAIEKPLEKSIDLNLVKNLIKEIKKPQFLDWFLENEYQPTISSSKDIQNWNDQIIEIDERGLFTRILLVELDEYSKRIAGRKATPEMIKEIKDFIDFIYTLSKKKKGEDVPLDFQSRYIRTGVIILARQWYIFSKGIDPYLARFSKKMKNQFHSIYVLQYDKEFFGAYGYTVFQGLTDQFREHIDEKFSIKKDFEQSFIFHDVDGNQRTGIITRYSPEDKENSSEH